MTSNGVKSVLKSEFSWKKLSLNFTNKDESIHRSWILPPWSLLMLRLALTTFCIAITLVSGVRTADPRWFIYLTNWSLLLLTMALAGLTFISMIPMHGRIKNSETTTGTEDEQEMRTRGEITEPERRPAQSEVNEAVESNSLVWYEKGVWILWIVSSNAALVVTLNYWVLIFEPPTDFMDIAVHALNSFVVLVELFTANTPVRILHVLYVMIFSIAYSLFSVIFWAAGGVTVNGDPFIYKVLDYENGDPGQISAAMLATVFVISPIFQFVLFGLYRLRCFIRSQKRNGTNSFPL
ncbi:protein rolling stone-like [Dendronephthya gigantea]|uniref:protein rolling stone-like n=1 Tax=Dendronephthya gigantea TaxID=151771 RepID=UPI00106C2964|nr:protein rolling stone-like [Dendronephthya gigantea]XP_028398520.1 protein rolling stone-like [Dendronephthya gigantea]